MTRTKKTVRLFLILLASILLSFQLMFTTAGAEQPLKIVDGVYQVELSFQSLEVGEHENLFGKKATLTVQKAHYSLSLPIKDASMMTVVSVEQSSKGTPFLLSKNENLVEFDVSDLQQAITLKGTIDSQAEQTIEFKERFTIETKLLPKIENLEPNPEPEPEVKPEPPTEPKPDDEQAKPSQPEGVEKPKEFKLKFKLLVDGKIDPSIMNTYVDPTLKVIKVDGHYNVEMKIIKSAWITGLKIENNGEMIEPETISLENNSRTIRFTVKKLQDKQTIWVKVDIPEINYHHDYQVQLVFDEDQVADLLGKTENPVKPEANEKKPVILEKRVNNAVKKEESVAIGPKLKLPDLPISSISPIMTTPVKKAQIEDVLAFDRTVDLAADEVKEDEALTKNKEVPTKQQPVSTDVKLATWDKIKIGSLIIVFIGSGYLLIRRIKRTKKHNASA